MKKALFFLIIILFTAAPSASAWADYTYKYRIANAINNGSGPYQLSLNVTNTTGTSNSSDLFTNGLCESINCSELKFYLDDTTVQSYWTKTNISGTDRGQIMLNITANGSNLYAYWGKGGVTRNNTLEGQNTFIQYHGNATTAYNDTGVKAQPLIYESRGRVTSASHDIRVGVGSGISGVYDRVDIELYSAGNARYAISYNEGALLDAQNENPTLTVGQAYDFKIILTPTRYDAYIDNNPIGSGFATSALNRPMGTDLILGTGTAALEYSYIRHYSANPPTLGAWGNITPLYYNDYTNDQATTFVVPQDLEVHFYYADTSAFWFDGVWTVATGTSGIYSYYAVNIINNKTIKAFKADFSEVVIWTPTITTLPLNLISPANTSTTVTPVTLTWEEWPAHSPYTYQVATDNQFLNIIVSGSGTMTAEAGTSGALNLDNGTKYYWKVINGLGNESDIFEFNTSIPAIIPGRLNITVFDEQNWNSRIMTFSAQIYNSTYTTNRSTTTGWVNFSSSEVASGEYLIRIVPNASFASRSLLATSPANVTMYIPSTANTIDTVAFYLLDYTNQFPWQQSVFQLNKNNSVMHSAYFDADAKVAAYLIRGDSYGVTVINGANLQNWGNYISTASGNVEVVIMDIGVNSTLRNPLVYNVTWSTSDVTMRWSDSFNVMNNINFTIYKGPEKTLVHQVITTVSRGTSQYIVTNTSDIYYVMVSASTVNGFRNQSYVIDYRAGQAATQEESSELYTWSYGSVTIPAWVKNAFAVVALMILAGSFGAMHRGEGAIITGIMSLVFWKWTWLSATGAGVGFLGALVLFAVLYHLETKRKGGGYF